MHELPTPVLTPVAHRRLTRERPDADRAERALLAAIDGRRNVVQLESVAKAMGLRPSVLEDLRAQGLVAWTPAGHPG